tara:strand:- start:1786 stop:3546 length:1761 start_codon:yes stop_codon:yes gene_type:complete
MKILKLLNKSYILIFFLFIFQLNLNVLSTEPVDIWKLEKKTSDVSEQEINSEILVEDEVTSLIDDSNNKSNNKNNIIENENLLSSDISLVGLYDPERNGLTIDMWSSSNGERLKKILDKISDIDLSNDSKHILDIALLTNSYFPQKDITVEDFLKFKSEYLIKNNDLNLIKKYLIKNKNVPYNSLLIKHYVNYYLSISDLKNACSIFNEIENFEDDYLYKFKIYCLINEDRREEAQLIYDLKRELGFDEVFFEKKFNLLMGYETTNDKEISEENILDFHLSHRTDPDFNYSPNEKTPKLIWTYLSSNNLLDSVDLVDLEDVEKIKIIEKATHDKNYAEQELFNLYKRFQFNIDQLLTVKDTYKILPSYKGRALLYQRLILTLNTEEKLDLSLKLKESFVEDGIGDAFSDKLSKILEQIKFEEVPSNYSTFYENNLLAKDNKQKRIKYNNKIIHQSKLLKYFLNEMDITKAEKETNDILKKIKKDKKYIVSVKDTILLESLKSDGVKISNKYDALYEPNLDIPYDIQLLIQNEETGMILLRIVEIIGEDELEKLGPETLNFIVRTLNLINMDKLRNRVLLKTLPLKI